MLDIMEGKIIRPQKVCIYGSEGVGKSTLASQFPDPLFIDTEGGTAQLAVRRIRKPETWEKLLAVVREVADTKDICKTLVIDTADWAEKMCLDYILSKYDQASIEGFGYGKGYTILGEEFSKLLTACDRVIASGKNVVICAHAKMRKQELPDEAGAFDRWEMKLSKQVAPLLKEWCDLLLFLNYQTYVVEMENRTKKAQGGRRVMYTSHSPVYDAKNRHGLPDVLDLDYRKIAFIFEDTGRKEPESRSGKNPADKPPDTPITKVRSRMQQSGITEEQLRSFVASKGHYSADVPVEDYSDRFLTGWVLKYWRQIESAIKNQ